MKLKKTHRTVVRDLRDIDVVKLAMPDVSDRLAGFNPSPETQGPNIVTPGVGVQTPGQTTHE